MLLCTFLVTITVSNVYAGEYQSVEEQYINLGVVQCPKYLNIRQQPDSSSSVVGLIENDGACEIKASGDSWYAIKSGNISGYVRAEYVVTGEKAKNLADTVAVKRLRTLELTPIYGQASLSSKVWDNAMSGAEYDITDETDQWYTIDLDGATGYIPTTANVHLFMGLDTATPTSNLENVKGQRYSLVKYAMKYLGKPYVWGGENPETGIDCSAFVRWCYSHTTDVQLPRVSYEQCYVGEKITSMEMKPGDLIFYADKTGRVGHVAMYIGNSTIIHAASSKSGIKLSQWNYRTPKYIRRLIE